MIHLWALLTFHYVIYTGLALQSVAPMPSRKVCEQYATALVTAGLDPHHVMCVDLAKNKRLFHDD